MFRVNFKLDIGPICSTYFNQFIIAKTNLYVFEMTVRRINSVYKSTPALFKERRINENWSEVCFPSLLICIWENVLS